jgi:hypothetical protein
VTRRFFPKSVPLLVLPSQPIGATFVTDVRWTIFELSAQFSDMLHRDYAISTHFCQLALAQFSDMLHRDYAISTHFCQLALAQFSDMFHRDYAISTHFCQLAVNIACPSFQSRYYCTLNYPKTSICLTDTYIICCMLLLLQVLPYTEKYNACLTQNVTR